MLSGSIHVGSFAIALWLGGFPLFCGCMARDVPDAEGCWFGVLFLYEVVDASFAVGTMCWRALYGIGCNFGLGVASLSMDFSLCYWLLNCCHLGSHRNCCKLHWFFGALEVFCVVAAMFQQPMMMPMVSELVHCTKSLAVHL
ncbi:hypothetical protein Nepgr_028319 [Nepenthes gracilis]|uniref:Transmembrane protein n=1 Tax=Nepenthes gracilis TaxID=150966 RepID=A0AAD3Y4E7_NEPGR|nr:hypothetical protein Nepgr_028319 [Nepenthes gracilis]